MTFFFRVVQATKCSPHSHGAFDSCLFHHQPAPNRHHHPPATLMSYSPSPPSPPSLHICFSSNSIPVFPKRALTCVFDELTLSFSPSLFLFHYLILFTISQSAATPMDELAQTQHTCSSLLLASHRLWPSVACLTIMWSVSVVLCV